MNRINQLLGALAMLPGTGTPREWSIGLGPAIEDILQEAERQHLAEPLTERWLDEHEFRPTPAELRALLQTIRDEVASRQVRGCPRCLDGARLIGTVRRVNGWLIEETRACACACEAGTAWAAGLAGARPEPVAVASVEEVVRDLARERCVALDGSADGLIEWTEDVAEGVWPSDAVVDAMELQGRDAEGGVA